MEDGDFDGVIHDLPSLYAKKYEVDKNVADQVYISGGDAIVSETDGKRYGECEGKRFRILGLSEQAEDSELAYRLADNPAQLSQLDFEEGVWENPPEQTSATQVLESLKGKFSYIKSEAEVLGLRDPQLGALHAISAAWTLEAKEPQTIVMPTGTGKTETMIALFAAHRVGKLLIVVPSDALRTQIADKMESYGVLQNFGVIGTEALKPIVGRVKHGFKSKLGARGFAQASNIVVTTSSALFESDEEIRKIFLEQFTTLFIDEAHHVGAFTWSQIRDSFVKKPIVQFTATPFREDGQRLGGRIAYSYPLKDAQANGYFSKINYISVVDFDDIDRAIATEAVKRLKEDIANGLDHLMMARAQTQARAESLHDLYNELAPELQPVVVHSGLPPSVRKQRLIDLRSQVSKIVICVDMLGEGFDLPELKVAAIHDPHKSLGVTLQFVGRFARVGGKNLGDATAVVGRGQRKMDTRLRELYAENTDWNKVIRNLSADAIEEQQELTDFESAFENLPDDISMVNLAPKMSTVVYRTNSTAWTPESIEKLYKRRLLDVPAVNHAEHVVWFVTKDVETVRWGDVKSISQTNYNLFIAYWDSTNHLLYINSSNNEGVYEDLAKALCSDAIEIYKGPDVYKTMGSLNRRIATNVGLLDARNRDSRFEMRVGANVIGALDDEARRNKSQTNIFAHGVDDKSGERLTIGASLKGRIWSHAASHSVKQWMEWCRGIGEKLKDPDINPADVMDGFIVPVPLDERPPLYALALEWPSDSYLDVEESLYVTIGDHTAPLIDVEFEITEFSDEGPIPFKIILPDETFAEYKIHMSGAKMVFTAVGVDAHIGTARSDISLRDYLNERGLRIIMEKEAVIEPNMIMVQPPSSAPAFNKDRIETLDWAGDGINIRQESRGQGEEKDEQSIQARMIRELVDTGNWDVIMDDDGSGEVADIVALKVEGQELVVELVHCKFSHEDKPGFRLIDLYEVAGQAQRSIARRRDLELLLETLMRRERQRRKSGKTGLVHGTAEKLHSIAEQSRLLGKRFTITIVQPGVSKKSISDEQLELIAATEKYIKDSGGNTPLRVITSE